jgi:hypothetical protein
MSDKAVIDSLDSNSMERQIRRAAKRHLIRALDLSHALMQQGREVLRDLRAKTATQPISPEFYREPLKNPNSEASQHPA